MSGYIIRGDGDYASIPVVNGGYPIDYSLAQMIPIEVEFGENELITIWKSGQAELQCTHYFDTQQTEHYSMRWTDLNGDFHVNDIGNVDTLYIGAVYSDSVFGSVIGYMAWNVIPEIPNPYGVLYDGDFSGMGAVEDREWDEEPSADPEFNPDNLGAIGGEYADTDYFDLTENISEFDMLDVPVEMDYGKLISAIVLHEDATQGYNLTQLNDCLFLADFWQNLKNKFEGLSDPLSMIISTIELPFTPNSSGTKIMKLGGITVVDSNDQPILVNKIGSRYEKRTCGSISLKEVWGSEKDYTQCSVEIYLPYVGVREIDVDLAVNYTLTLYANIDRWTGDILYSLYATNKLSSYKYMTSEFVAYRWTGNCAKQVPLGKVDNSSAILSLLGMPIKATMGVVTGGAVGGAIATGGALLNTDLSPIVQSSGSIAGSVGRMDLKYPYLIIKRGVPSYPNNWRTEFGAPRYQELRVGDISGYTEFAEIHADDIPGATDSEKAEIENLLKSGVFIN